MSNVTNEKMNKVNGAANNFLNKLPTSPDQLENMVHKAGEKAGELTSNFAETATSKFESGRSYVKENPIKGVAIAAAAGIATGSLLTMMFRGNKNN
jgi:ElaB/YqjD/DUF883 family membrane-anchored ribosome-binding protein